MDYQAPNAAAPADDDDKTEVTAEGDTPVVKDPEAEEATEEGGIEPGVDGDGDEEEKAEGADEDEEETEAVA
jgi:hypothetical protein